jgi:hypothetical protein
VTVSVTRTADLHDDVNRTIYTFSGASLGTEASGRVIVVCVSSGQDNEIRTISSVTVAGNSCRINAQTGADGGSVAGAVGIASLVLASGTTGDIVVTFSSAAPRNCGITVYNVTGLSGETEFDFASSTSDPASMTISVEDGGCIIGVTNDRNTAGTVTWTGITEDVDDTIEASTSTTHSTAFEVFETGETDKSVTADLSTTPNAYSAVVVSWSPAAASNSFTLAAEAGSYAVTGVAASLIASRKLPAAAGSYAVTGVAVDLLVSRLLSAAAGSYVITGAPVTFTYSEQEEVVVATPNFFFGIGPMGKTRVHPHPLFCRVKQ